MSASPDAMAALLSQSGLLAQPQSGLMGAINSQLAPYGGAAGLGIALLGNTSGATAPGAALGQAMTNAQQLNLQNQQRQLQNAGLQQDLAMKAIQTRMFMSAYPAWLQQLTGEQASPQQGQTQPLQAAPPPQDPNEQSVQPAVARLPGQSFAQTAAAAQPQQAPSVSDPFAKLRMAMIGSAMGMPGAKEMLDVAKTELQYDPQLATKLEAAKSAISVDQQMLEQALRSGDTATAWGLSQKLQQDMGLVHIASMSGTRTQITPNGITTIDPRSSMFTLQNGQGLTQGLIPGAAGALQQKAASEALGAAQGKPAEVVDPSGNKYTLPLSTVLGAGIPGAPGGAPGASPAGRTPFQTGIGPAQAEMLKGNAESAIEANKGYQAQVDAGQQMLTNTAELRHAAADFSPGQFADARAAFLNLLNSANLITPAERNSLGSAQVGQKIAIQLQAAATKQLGSREAAQIFAIMGKSLPNLTLSADGLEKVSAYLDGIARYNIARGQVAQQRASQNDYTGLNNVRNDFVKNTNPLYFIIASAAPAQQQEILNAMGDKKASFVKSWNDAALAGWAPRPGQYRGNDGGA